METVTVHASRTYDILIGDGLLEESVSYLSPIVKSGTVAIVSDDRVYPLYGGTLQRILSANGNQSCCFVFPSGERSKNTDTYIQLLNFLAENGLSRSDTVIALGGGVTGDMAGFAAATYMRGIHFVQMPTTLLAAVDSSVGGKTGIDLRAGKTWRARFTSPTLCYAITACLIRWRTAY